MMTSNAPTECFVYLTLPRAVSAVTAGRFALTTNRAGAPLGKVVYGRSYRNNAQAMPIDPVELVLSDKTYETVQLTSVFCALPREIVNLLRTES